MSDIYVKLDLLDRTLERNLNWIRAADLKIYPIFAIDAAMLGVLAALAPSGDWWTITVAIAPVLAVSLLLASIVCLAIASFPRLKNSKRSVVYFGSAIGHDESEYIRRFSEGPTPELIQDLGSQAYRSAAIAYSKYLAIRWAIILQFSGVPPWLIAVWLLYQSQSAAATP